MGFCDPSSKTFLLSSHLGAKKCAREGGEEHSDGVQKRWKYCVGLTSSVALHGLTLMVWGEYQ